MELSFSICKEEYMILRSNGKCLSSTNHQYIVALNFLYDGNEQL